MACAAAAPAHAASPQPGAKRIKYRFGPISVAPGQNTILIGPNGEKPNQDGYITGQSYVVDGGMLTTTAQTR